MWEWQSVKRPLKWKLKKLMTVIYYLLMLLVVTACLFVICLLRTVKHW